MPPLLAVEFTGTIELGTVIQTISIVITVTGAAIGVASSVQKELAAFRETLRYHAETLAQHSDRMEKHDKKIGEVAESLQFLRGLLQPSGGQRTSSAPPF